MTWPSKVLILVLVLGGETSARADLIITFSSSTIYPEQTGTIDVFVTGEGLASGDAYVGFVAVIGVRPFADNNPISLMKFTPTATQSTAYASESDYVFFGQSAPGFPMIAVSSFPLAPDLSNRATVADTTPFGFPPSTVEIDGKKLLTRLILEHEVNSGVDPSLALGNKFDVFVDSSTFFRPFGIPGETPTSEPGVITSIPEPTSLSLSVMGALVILGLGWRRRRKRQASITSEPADTAS